MGDQIDKVRSDLLRTLLTRVRPLSIRNELLTLEYVPEDIERCMAYGIPEDENNSETKIWRKIFTSWDNSEGSWTISTEPRSKERRNLIYSKLDFEGTELQKSLIKNIPLNEPKIEIAIISRNKNHEDWVDANRFHNFGYWERYKQYLLGVKGWDAHAVDSVDKSSTRILNHLNDPLGTALTPTKGLVVGYVQSGKTANYSALIAKAVDTGYSMIVVLSGRTDILRNQTQARLDMEVLGWESLDAGEQAYYCQKSIAEKQNYTEKFIKGEIKPPSLAVFRLTKAQKDFNAGSIALKDTGSPCIAVLKKMPGRLKAFAKILGKSNWKNKLVLLIDDEADDASVNTSKTSITTTPSLIADLLKASDFSQYVGYTATPYANVFIRPEKVEELFPRDFVVCLERPEHYMGALETFDISDCELPVRDGGSTLGNEQCHIRTISEKEMEAASELESPPKLDVAIDSFMLAGGIKLWRIANCRSKFNHHTMLINTDSLTDRHDDTAREVEGLIANLYPNNRLGSKENQRLKMLWEQDFAPVCKNLSSEGSIPGSWEQISPFVKTTLDRVTEEGIRLVNHKNNQDTPDFDVPGGFWGILIGGSKLSRGYTIEGLTTTYFSRKPGQLDTLVQMARWYGFRKGYQDLVRLFIPQYLAISKNKKNRRKKYHLLEAFRFGAMVEEAFRKNLSEYSKTLKPEDIPPLVQYEFEEIPEKFKYLKPTAQNKKRYAKFITTYLGGVARTITRIAGEQNRRHNMNQLEKYLDTCNEGLFETNLKFSEIESVSAITGISTSKDYCNFIKNLIYSDKEVSHVPKVIIDQVTALNKMPSKPWRVVMYKRQREPGITFDLAKYKLPLWTRNYDVSDGVLIYDKPLDPLHKQVSAWMAYHKDGTNLNSLDKSTLELRNKDYGIAYLVPFSSDERPRDYYFLWCAFFPGKGSAGAYQVTHKSNLSLRDS